MAGASILAHGGTAGLVFEIGFLALPIIVFAALAWWSGRRRKEAEGLDRNGPTDGTEDTER